MVLIQKTEDFSMVQDIRTKIFKNLGLSGSDIFDEDDKMLEQFFIVHDDNTISSFRLREINNFHI